LISRTTHKHLSPLINRKKMKAKAIDLVSLAKIMVWTILSPKSLEASVANENHVDNNWLSVI